MAEEEEEQQAPDGTPDIRAHFSRSVRDVGAEVGWGEVTASRIVHILLRNHADYGGSALLPLDQTTGRIQPMDLWLAEVAAYFDLDAVRARRDPRTKEPGVIDGRMTILGLTFVDPYLSSALEEAGFRKRLEAALGPRLQAVLLSGSDRRPQDLGEEVPDTLAGMSNRAQVLIAQGDLAGGRALQEEVLARSRRVFGEDHPNTLTGMSSLAATLGAQGDLAEARALQEEVLAQRQRVLGPDHPDTLVSMSSLAATLGAQGDLAGARALQEEELATTRRVFGEDHLNTLASMSSLAETLRAQGELGDARVLQEQVLAQRQHVLGPDHPDTLASADNLAGTLGELGELDEARALEDKEAETSEAAGSPVDPPTTSVPDDQQDAIELVGDLAATEDELGRAPIAHDLGRRLARIHHDDDRQQGSFLVHLDGPWGAGKSSILNFLRDDLEGRGPEPREPGWLVVDFNAWRERRARPPWRALLASLRAAVRSELTLLGRARFWFAELRRRVSQIGATGLIAAILLIVAVAALVLAWVSGGLTTVAALVTTAATLVALVIAAARASGRFLFWGSERSAETFEETEEKPMQRLADHFAWLIQLVGEERLRRRPWTSKARLPTHRSEPSANRVHHSRATIFFIDDLDRCQAEHVVELMEAVQNLIRDAGSGRGPYFVIAADGRWIRRSYESSFERFGETVAEAGRPLGYLFLDKLFQMSVQVPSMTGGDQDGFMGRLLGVGAESIAPPGTPVQQPPSKEEVLQKVEAGATEESFTAAVAMAEALPAADRQEVVARVVAREAEEGQADMTKHRLQPYARHLPPNPRTMKRFINAYEIARAVDRVEGRAVTPEKRAIWTVLRLRWPVLADHLQGDPELLDALETADPAGDDLTVRLLAGGDVRRLLLKAKGAPFTAADLRACCGIEEPMDLPVASTSSSVPA